MARDFARGKQPKKTTKPKASVGRSLLTLVIAISFIGGLWFLAQQPKDQTAPAPATTATPVDVKPIAKPATESAEEAPESADNKSGFDFYNLLPESQVTPQKVEAYKSTPKDPSKKTNVLLQAGSFRKLEDAERLRAQLILLNLPNVVTDKTTSSSGSVWYRVRVGPFDNRSMLNKAEDILAQNNIVSLRINRKQ